MNNWLIVIFSCWIALAAIPSGARAEHYRVFILAGQSNMDGRGKKEDLIGDLAQWAKPQMDVSICYSNSTLRGPYTSGGWKPLEAGYSVPPGTREKSGGDFKLPAKLFGPEVSFGRTVADGLKDQHIALIKFSEGGTSLHKDWNPDQRGLLYDQCLGFVRQSLKSITDRGDTYELAAVVWHQGESDASLKDGEYQKLLTQFIAHIRKDLDLPQLPFVIGEVYDNGQRDNVRAGQLGASRTIDNVFFVSVNGLKTSDNGTHFDTPGQIELGKRLGRAFLLHRSLLVNDTGAQ